MFRPGSCTLFGIGLLVSAACLTLTPPLTAQGFTPPPTRKACVGGTMKDKVCTKDADCPGGGSCKDLECNDWCPPARCTFDAKGNVTSYRKIEPDASYGDKPHTNTLTDYFLGEWKFVEGNNDVIIRKWCLNGGPPNGAFQDAYSVEIATSTGEKETTRIPPAPATGT